jgi:hypothetical protein
MLWIGQNLDLIVLFAAAIPMSVWAFWLSSKDR